MVRTITKTRSKKAKAPQNQTKRRANRTSQSKVKLINAQEPKVSVGLCPRCKGMELRNKHSTAK